MVTDVLFYEAWKELDEMEASLGLEPAFIPDECAVVLGSGGCSGAVPCEFHVITGRHGRPPWVHPLSFRPRPLKRERRWM